MVNVQLPLIAESEVLAHGNKGNSHPFMCECGCVTMLDLPLAVYDAGGAWIDGQKPE